MAKIVIRLRNSLSLLLVPVKPYGAVSHFNSVTDTHSNLQGVQTFIVLGVARGGVFLTTANSTNQKDCRQGGKGKKKVGERCREKIRKQRGGIKGERREEREVSDGDPWRGTTTI